MRFHPSRKSTKSAAPPHSCYSTKRISPPFPVRCSARRARGIFASATRLPWRKSSPAWRHCDALSSELVAFSPTRSVLLRLSQGAGGLDARRSQQARNLLQMQLHRVSAQNLALRKLAGSVGPLLHASV